MPPAPRLFGHDAPPGFAYREHFIAEAEEAEILAGIANLDFSPFEMRGVVAKRRVAFFGQSYDRSEAPPLPDFLLPLRERIAAWAGIDPQAFATALVNAYPPGAPIGWHRDAPQYDIVAGVSLLSDCRMRFRPYRSPASTANAAERRTATREVWLERRSAYLLTGESRTGYEHHIPAVTSLRFSVTFRTLRRASVKKRV